MALWGLYLGFWNLGAVNVGTDETVYVNAGWQYVHGNLTMNREHPPTAKYIYGLFQLLFGEGLLSGRVAAALLAFLTGVVIFVWLRGELGWYGALTAAAFWWIVPRGSGVLVKFDRVVSLEVCMVLFAVCASAAAWFWYRRGHWWWAAISGAFLALSVTSKVTTAVLFPSILILVMAARRWRRLAIDLGAYVGAFAVTFVLLYLPMRMVSAIRYMLAFQGAHDADGHPINLMGQVVAHPPWWTTLYFAYMGLGVAVAVLVVVAIAAAARSPARVLTVYVAANLALLMAFYLVVAKIALPYYYYVWTWALFVLAAIGVHGLWQRRGVRSFASVIAVVLTAGLLGAGIPESRAVAIERPTGFALVPGVLRQHHLDGVVLVTGYKQWAYQPFLSRVSSEPAVGGPFVAVAVNLASPLPTPDPRVVRIVRAHPSWFGHLRVDDVDLYLPHGTLRQVGGALAVTP